MDGASCVAGVGCMVDSCRTCPDCKDGYEQFCHKGCVFSYNSPDAHLGGMTYGGYTNVIVVDEAFVLRIPDGLDPAGAAPLLCAGITTYSPLRHWGAGPGKKVGIVGLGGLGHMGVKIAHAMGAHVVLFTTSAGKIADGKRLGADEVCISSDPEAMARYAGQLDFILNTVAAPHDLDAYLQLLKRDGTMTLVGAPAEGCGISHRAVTDRIHRCAKTGAVTEAPILAGVKAVESATIDPKVGAAASAVSIGRVEGKVEQVHDAADGAALPVVLPARPGEVPARDALERDDPALLDEDGPAGEEPGVRGELRRESGGVGLEEVVPDEPLELPEPEGRELRQDRALAGDPGGEDDVEGGDPVRGDDEEAIPEVVDVPDLAAAGGRETGKGRRVEGGGRHGLILFGLG